MAADRLVLPPVRLLPAAELARCALAVPRLDRAVRLARWAAAGMPVDAAGELLDAGLRQAAARRGLLPDGPGEADGPGAAGAGKDGGYGGYGTFEAERAWDVAVGTGLVELRIDGTADQDLTAPVGQTAGQTAGRAAGRAGGAAEAGPALVRLDTGEPGEILAIWLGACEAVLAEAVAPDPEAPRDAVAEDGNVDPEASARDFGQEAEFLDLALARLYSLSAAGASGAGAAAGADDPAEHALGPVGPGSGRAVPLPVLAASLVLPDDMREPTDTVLEEVTDVMMRLDDRLRLIAPIGLIEYRPVDESLVEEMDEEGPLAADEVAPSEISRYGLVRLTALGMYAVRERLIDSGVRAPALGDLTARPAAELLEGLARYPEWAACAEAELWLGDRKADEAARELLEAAHGDDPDAPKRRLMCQQVLGLLGADAEPALRDVLDDRRLGGLARVWLTEQGAENVPAPDAPMVYWLTVDTLAAQLGAGEDPRRLAESVRDLVAGHKGFLDAVRRIDHPATADVLDAVGCLHPDRTVAEEARKAAFAARSRSGPKG